MDMLSLNNALEYLYDKFILTFILCLIGAIIREIMNTAKMTSINIKRMMASVIMASTLMCIVLDYIDFQFSVYIVICIIAGVWSPFIMKIILDSKIMAKLLKVILGSVKEPIAKELSEVITELDENKDKDQTNDKDSKSTSDEGEKTDDS